MGACAQPATSERQTGPVGPLLPPRAGEHPLWLFVLLGLCVWQGSRTLGLFDAGYSLGPLLDDQPVVSGRHALHLYHGSLGARSLRVRGSLSCFDPCFQAGYPKTPVFDSGSRPAELMLTVAGGDYRPAAYKIGLALLCAAVPFLVYGGARGVGLSRGASCLACALALLVWWGQPGRVALEAGDLDLLGATVLVVAQAGLLVRFHRDPGPLSLGGIVATGLLGWFAHPLLLFLLLPVFLVYYLSVGCGHRLPWHAALLGGLLAAVAINAFWLLDWIGYWWIRVPLHAEVPRLPHRTLRTIWESPLWGEPFDRGLALLLLGAGLLGVLLLERSRARAGSRLLGLTVGGLLALTLAGITTDLPGRLGTAQLLVPALLFAALPAAHALAAILGRAGRLTGRIWIAPAVLAIAAVTTARLVPAVGAVWSARLQPPAPLQIGLTPEQAITVATLEAHTSPDARILWEDQHGSRQASRWTALLPLMTEKPRYYLGGLDPEAGIEHSASGLIDGVLAGRPIQSWSEGELLAYFDSYNIGWVVTWSEPTRLRFAALPQARPLATLRDGARQGHLFALRRRHSFALVGAATWEAGDAQRVVLGNVFPERRQPEDSDGQVVLSLHFQEGMRVLPSRVRIEPALRSHDHIPFVRLRVADPVALVTITWGKR